MGDVKGAIHTTCKHSSCAREAKEIKEEGASRMSGDWGHQGCAQVRRLENYVDITFWDSTDTTRTSHTPWTSQTWQPPHSMDVTDSMDISVLAHLAGQQQVASLAQLARQQPGASLAQFLW